MKRLLAMILVCLVAIAGLLYFDNGKVYAEEDEGTAYAVLTDEGDLIFFRSNATYENETTRTVTDINGNKYKGTVYKVIESENDGSTSRNWGSEAYSIKKVYVAEGCIIKPVNMEGWFSGETNLESFDGTGFDTSNVTRMRGLFWDCRSLVTVDLSSFNTSKVTNMSDMFWACFSLTSLDLSSFDTSNVAYMSNMFFVCNSLTSLNLSSFDTSNVVLMGDMFSDCSSLTSLDVSGFDTTNVINMQSMFSNCSSLTSLDVSNFDTSKVINMGGMFENCSSLTSLDVSNFSTSNTSHMNDMFANCSLITSLDISSFDTSNVISTIEMFKDDTMLKTIYASDSFIASDSIESSDMFDNCTELVGGNGTKYDANHVDKEYARIDKTGQSGYFTDINNPLAAPTISSVSMNTEGVTVKWNKVIKADKYAVYRKAEGESSFTKVKTLTGTSYKDTTALAGVKYAYKVKAYNSELKVYSDSSKAKTFIYNPFSDVETSNTHFKRIMWAFNKGIVGGTSKTTFTPTGTCKRRSFALMLWKMLGKPAPTGTNPFTDISGCTANEQKAIQWCYENGIAGGNGTSFSPDGEMTRKQVVIMLWKAAGKPKVNTTENPFTDIKKLTSNEQKAILWAYENGITKGTSADKFSPDSSCTREQLCTFLYKYNALLHIID